MPLRLATWNINSVRLRHDLVVHMLKTLQPDVLCLQEIKCTNEQFPADTFRQMGYSNIAVNGQKGYHGVATLSRLPIIDSSAEDIDGSGHSRHLATTIQPKGRGKRPLTVHNFYVPSGGDIPDSAVNPKFNQKLGYLDRMSELFQSAERRTDPRRVLVGDLNVAPYEHDVWSHKQMLKVVSHTPVECEKLINVTTAGQWTDVMRTLVPMENKLYTWWSYRSQDWRASNRGRRLDHIWTAPDMANSVGNLIVHDEARDWAKPSDHVPVMIDLDS